MHLLDQISTDDETKAVVMHTDDSSASTLLNHLESSILEAMYNPLHVHSLDVSEFFSRHYIVSSKWVSSGGFAYSLSRNDLYSTTPAFATI